MDTKAEHAGTITPFTAPEKIREGLNRTSTWFSNLRVGQKLGLIAVTFSLPIGVQFALLATEQQKAINVARSEVQGAEALKPLSALVGLLDANASAQIRLRAGDFAAQDSLDQTTESMQQTLDELTKIAAANPQLGLEEKVKQFSDLWTALQGSSGQIQAVIKLYGETLPVQVADLIQVTANESRLSLDPELDSSYTQELLVSRLPELRRLFSQMELVILAAQRPEYWSPTTQEQLRALQSQATTALGEALKSIEYAKAARPSLEGTLGQAAAEYDEAAEGYLQQVTRQLLSPSVTAADVQEATELRNRLQASTQNLSDTAHKVLDQMLNERISRHQRSRAISLLAIGAIVAAAVFLLLAIARSITRPLGELSNAAAELAKGNLNVYVPPRSADEIGVVSTTFNDAVAQLRDADRRNTHDREASQQLQAHISEFLDVTMDIADGDLTKRGRVTEDVLGNVVDSINLMVGELESVLRNVRDASSSVTDGAAAMLATTDQIVQGAQTTASLTERVTNEVQDVTSSIRHMAGDAQASAQTAQLALNASQQGQQAVESTLAGMQNIRREVQGISKRIKGLGDRSLEIQEIVDTISRITRQTNLLALNAAIEAAGAGEAGSRFAVVADEVRKLADSSAQATGRIASLIKSVQAEIKEVVVSVEDGTREVEAGYRVAGTAGERLAEIAQLAQRSAELAASISDATQAQVQGVEQVSGAVSSIASVASESRHSVLAGREAAERLRELADHLTEQLARFRLS